MKNLYITIGLLVHRLHTLQQKIKWRREWLCLNKPRQWKDTDEDYIASHSSDDVEFRNLYNEAFDCANRIQQERSKLEYY
jgi:hypothetical protein